MAIASAVRPSQSAPLHLDPLLEGARAGHARALRALYEAHVDRVYMLTLRITGDHELAMECTQDAFARAFRWLDTFRGDAAFSTWLHRLTVNVSVGTLSKVRRRQELEGSPDGLAGLAAEACQRDPMLRRRIRAALDSLPEMYRTVVVMHDLEGFTHEEIGTLLNVSPGTSKSRLSRARKLLRPLLLGCAAEYGTQ